MKRRRNGVVKRLRQCVTVSYSISNEISTPLIKSLRSLIIITIIENCWNLVCSANPFDMMVQRWNKKRAHFPLIVFLFGLFILSSILYNERSIRQIHQNPDHNDGERHQDSITSTTMKLPSRPNRVPGYLSSVQPTRVSGFLLSWTIFFSNFFTGSLGFMVLV